MKLGQFKTIAEPPVSNVAPASDYIIAQRIAKLHEQFTILDDAGEDNPLSWQIKEVRAKLQHKLKVLMKEHDDAQAAFTNWIEAGRPDL